MRLQRMLSILLMIEAQEKVKAKDLALKLETSVRTIYRDIDCICEAGIPLTTTTGPNGGISFMDGYKIDIKNMGMDEIKNLYLAAIGINGDNKSNMTANVNSALLKIQNNLSPNLNKELNKFTKRFLVDQNPWWGEKSTLNCIDNLMQSLWENIKLSIIYKKLNQYTSKRVIRPYGIVVKESTWYLIAFCENIKDIRTFRCDRIIECDFINESFTIPNEFSLEDYWHKSNDKFIKECEEREQYKVKIRLNKTKNDKLKYFEIYSMQDNEEYIEAVVNMYNFKLAEDALYNIIGYAEILEPSELRICAENKLKHMLAKYR